MKEVNISGKNILLIMPQFHEHDKCIAKTLEKWGANVTIIYENMRTINLFYKAIWNLSQKLGYSLMDFYYFQKLRRVEKVDILFVIKGESISEKTMNYICSRYPKSKKLLYEWDSAFINPQCLIIEHYFDAVASFDPVDASQYNWNYRPLFFEHLDKEFKEKTLYDISFVGTLHTQRAKIFQQAKTQAAEKGLRFYGYLYSNFFTYYVKKYIKRDSSFQGLKLNEIHFKSLKQEEIIQIYRTSKVVLDCAASGQNGFTMRTIEALCNGCKLLTNNENVRNISLFQPDNVTFYDENNFELPRDFCEVPFVPLASEIVGYYTLECWLTELLRYLELEK